MDVARRDDPLMLVQELNQRLFEYFEYVPRHTRVDSPIDEAIVSGTRRLSGLRPHHDRACSATSAFPRAMSPAISTAAAKIMTAPPPTQHTHGLTYSCRI